jgi:alkanesulfonate monooxygenase SsuD/methylene tetrahydromethanopterin reductase-like flavin-dependent oxidoreductase (luciferase family)
MLAPPAGQPRARRAQRGVARWSLVKFAVFSLMQWPEDRSQGDVYRDELEQAVLAESQGYHAVWLAEHHFSRYGVGPSIHLTAANLAARTRRIRIGTAVTIVPFYHPIRIAEEIAMLDQLSGGRIDWGAGRGYQGHEFAGFGADITQSHRVFREALDIILRAWTGEPFAFEGEFYRFPALRVLPTPLQTPHPPVWIAAISPETLAWAADHAWPVLTDQFSPLHRIEESRKLYSERAAAAGLDVARVELPTLRHVYVGETFQKAREEAAPALLWYYRMLGRVGSPASHTGELPANYAFYKLLGQEGLDPDRDRDAFLAYLFEHCTVVGDAAYCRDKLREMQERIRLDHLIAWQNFGGLPHAASLASQRRLIEKVAPAFL